MLQTSSGEMNDLASLFLPWSFANLAQREFRCDGPTAQQVSGLTFLGRGCGVLVRAFVLWHPPWVANSLQLNWASA